MSGVLVGGWMDGFEVQDDEIAVYVVPAEPMVPARLALAADPAHAIKLLRYVASAETDSQGRWKYLLRR